MIWKIGSWLKSYMKKKIKNCLIVGLGKIGMMYDFEKKNNYSMSHISSIKKSNYFSLYGAVDTDSKKKKICNNYFKIRTFDKIEHIDKKKFDLIIISTPTDTHYDVIKKILSLLSPKVILVEKPFTNSFLKAKKLSNLIKNKVKIFVNYSRISDISSLFIKKKLIKATYSNCKVFYSKSLLNNCSHFINLFQFFFGDIIQIKLLKKNNFLLKFSNAEVSFLKKNYGRSNNFIIKNNKFIIDYRFSSKSIFLVRKNFRRPILSYNNNINYYVIKNLENFLEKKKYRLCHLKEALKTHEALSQIKKYLN